MVNTFVYSQQTSEKGDFEDQSQLILVEKLGFEE